jgi:hypothetical protein
MGLGQDKQVCPRPLGAWHMGPATFVQRLVCCGRWPRMNPRARAEVTEHHSWWHQWPATRPSGGYHGWTFTKLADDSFLGHVIQCWAALDHCVILQLICTQEYNWQEDVSDL